MNDALETSLANANMVMHPPGMVMNAGWIQQTAGDFYFYREGITEAVGRVMAAIEAERMRIGAALGVRTQPLLEMLRDMGVVSKTGLQTDNFSAALRGSEMASSIRSPNTLWRTATSTRMWAMGSCRLPSSVHCWVFRHRQLMHSFTWLL